LSRQLAIVLGIVLLQFVLQPVGQRGRCGVANDSQSTGADRPIEPDDAIGSLMTAVLLPIWRHAKSSPSQGATCSSRMRPTTSLRVVLRSAAMRRSDCAYSLGMRVVTTVVGVDMISSV
jgi:hypothetical protein